MILSKQILVTLLITTYLGSLYCNKEKLNEEKHIFGSLERSSDEIISQMYLNKDSAYEDSMERIPYRTRNIDTDGPERNRHKYSHHHGRSRFLEIMGIIFLFILSIGVLYGAIWLINRFLLRKNKKEYSQWKEFKQQVDLEQSMRNDPRINNVNRNHADLNNNLNQNINNSGYSFINLQRNIQNDFNNPFKL